MEFASRCPYIEAILKMHFSRALKTLFEYSHSSNTPILIDFIRCSLLKMRLLSFALAVSGIYASADAMNVAKISGSFLTKLVSEAASDNIFRLVVLPLVSDYTPFHHFHATLSLILLHCMLTLHSFLEPSFLGNNFEATRPKELLKCRS